MIQGAAWPAAAAPLLLWLVLLAGCSRPTTLEKIHQEGVLHVITRNGPITYFEGRDGPAGYEFELARLLAEHLGVRLRVRLVDDLEQIYQVTEQGYTHIAAVGISKQAAERRNPAFRFSQPFLTVRPLVLYRKGGNRPRTPEDLAGRHIVVPAQTAQVDHLASLQEQIPGLAWQVLEDVETPEILRMLDAGEVEIAIVNSTEYAVNSALFPQVQEAFPLMEELGISWILPPDEDDSLLSVVNAFLRQAREDGTLLTLQERYYGHVDQLDYVGARTFMRHIRERLPQYEPTFRAAAERQGLDWRLLAAIGYQESHWRPYATSPTGVRGLMMLTEATARDMGVTNRLNPVESIQGGAAYFRKIHDRLPATIVEPHRTWFALAAYNVGYGHLEDARVLTDRHGLDPNVWEDVRQHLPLLQLKKWYTQTRYGYARGWEPVHYVQNVRRYYEVLSWKLPEVPFPPDPEEETPNPAPLDELAPIDPLAPTLPEAFRVTPPTL